MKYNKINKISLSVLMLAALPFSFVRAMENRASLRPETAKMAEDEIGNSWRVPQLEIANFHRVRLIF
ncbi:MAG: hypothetical protein JSS34_01030 [Proteobacteria bacterium]|nr:hypothetical protein [Pseudomonadota bacterium]